MRRLAGHAGIAGVLVAGSLFVGMAGFVYFFEGMTWLKAFLNAAMLLGGMGPIDVPQTPGGELFAGMYALYAGLVFIAVSGIVLAPVVHRVLHVFHWERAETEKEEQGRD